MDKYFTLFVRVAISLKWPRNVWTLLLQCVLVGKSQEAHASLSPQCDSFDYDKMIAAILRIHELMPEAYKLKFNKLRKQNSQIFVEFTRVKEALFDSKCESAFGF